MNSLPGHTCRDHVVAVPLCPNAPDGRTIEVFAREVVRAGRENAPYLVWFQGGPGIAAPRPTAITGWLDRALADFRVILLDQRGTGRSSAINAQTLAPLAGAATDPATARANYVSHFRAQNIVHDAEAIRAHLGSPPWTVLGQSFGGFVVTTYLSFAPQGLTRALITAGLPPLTTTAGTTAHARDVYATTFTLTARRNRDLFSRYPADRLLAGQIACHLADTAEYLPTGERLTPERFQQLGILLGTTTGIEKIHQSLNSPFHFVGQTRRIRPATLAALGQQLSFAAHPLYATIHESIYGRPGLGATGWAAEIMRKRTEIFATPPQALGDRFMFTGEHIFPWQFAQDPALTPLADVADHLAQKSDWEELYDLEALGANQVPAAAAIYEQDMFVAADSQLRTAKLINGMRTVTSAAYHHDAIRVDGYALLDQLLALV